MGGGAVFAKEADLMVPVELQHNPAIFISRFDDFLAVDALQRAHNKADGETGGLSRQGHENAKQKQLLLRVVCEVREVGDHRIAEMAGLQ